MNDCDLVIQFEKLKAQIFLNLFIFFLFVGLLTTGLNYLLVNDGYDKLHLHLEFNTLEVYHQFICFLPSGFQEQGSIVIIIWISKTRINIFCTLDYTIYFLKKST